MAPIPRPPRNPQRLFAMARARRHFGAEYYRRFYGDAATRSVTRAEVGRQVAFVAAYLKHMAVPVRRVLDLGCGLGMMRAPLARAFPSARYTGVEWSEHLCERLGWAPGSVVDFSSRWPFDLVICYDVIQYLDDADAARAIDNLARLCRGVLYLGVLTLEDWRENCDPERTDDQVHLRPARWYRRRLARHFSNAGGGLFVKHEAPVVLWSLERSE